MYNFQRQVFNSKDPNEIKLYLNNHQRDIVKLLRLLLNKIDTNQKNSIYGISDRFNQQDLIKNSFHYLEKIAHFLFISFSNYIDKSIPATFFFLTSKVIIWKSRLEEIISLCTGKISQDLLDVVPNLEQRLVNEIKKLEMDDLLLKGLRIRKCCIPR